MLKSFITGTVIIVLTLFAFWYFLIKPYDYSISFKTEKTPGEVYQQLLYYEFTDLKKTGEGEKVPLKQLSQKVYLKGEHFRITWKFIEHTDSLTRVTANVENLDNSFLPRVKLLFGNEESQDLMKKEINGFQEEVKKESQFYTIQVMGKTVSPATTCACIALESEVRHKARYMMKTINLLSSYISYNNIETIARPRINVKSWNLDSNEIEYEFCFPVNPDAKLADKDKIYVKKIPGKSSIQAIFNGNYMYSHLAWVKLLDYAEAEGIEVLREPLEIFNDNPELGGDARQWEAEIYLPLKDQ